MVLNLADIQTSTMSYRMRLEIWCAWPLTKEEVESYVKDPDNWKPRIRPDPVPWTISIEDIHKMPFLSGRTTQVFMWRDKVVACECTLVTALYLESMELMNFPFDCQHFNFHIGIRCDCDLPMRLSDEGEVQYKPLKAIEGFLNFDGRAMAKLKLDERGCTFNARTHWLILKDFDLANIECEIENMAKDIPFLHCSLRMSRSYNSYVYRIFVPVFVITLNATLVFRFDVDLGNRLNYLITNLLTIVAFYYILATILPNISYLTVIDKYMLFNLIFVGSMAMICVIIDYLGKSDPNSDTDQTDNYLFVALVGVVVFGHIFFVFYCMYVRSIEIKKITFNRHEVELEEIRIGMESADKEEYLAHTFIHPKKGVDIHNEIHTVYEGTLRSRIDPVEAAGWLFDGKGKILDGKNANYANLFKQLSPTTSPLLPNKENDTTKLRLSSDMDTPTTI